MNAQYNVIEAIEPFDELIAEDEGILEVHLRLVDGQGQHRVEERHYFSSEPVTVKGSLTVAF